MIEGIYQFQFNKHGDWLRSRIPYIRTEDACGFVVLDKNGKPCGAAIFDNFLYSSAQMTLVLDSAIAVKVGLLEYASDFLFNDCGKKSCFALVAMTNKRSLRLCKRVGFRIRMVIEEGYAKDVDIVVLELHRDELNLKSRKCQRVKHATQ